MTKTKIVISLTVLSAVIIGGAHAQKMRLEDLQAITLHENKMAATRRYSQPMPQLVCVGGKAGCHDFIPKTVLCKNEGWDGYSIQWECKADMPAKYSFGTISVVCEGYDYPDDPYILKGSCSLEYTVEYSSKADHSDRKSAYHKVNNIDHHGGQWSTFTIVMGLIMLGYIIYSKFLSDNNNPAQHERPSGPDIGWNIPNSNQESSNKEFNEPPCGSGGAAYNQYGFENNRAHQGLGGGGGFWTGLGTGGLLGYMFGSRRSDSRPSSTDSQGFHPVNKDDDDNSETMSTATAYGGTKRR